MGVFHGFYFGSFLEESEMEFAVCAGGSAAGRCAAADDFAYLLARFAEGAAWLRPVRSGAVVLFVIGLAWFVMRVRSSD